MTTPSLEDILQDIQNQLGSDFIATDVVGMDGLSIAGRAANPNLDSTAAAARFAMVMKLASNVTEKIGMGDVEDSLVTTTDAYILTRFLGDGSYYWGITVTINATLGLVRMLMSEYANQIWEALPH